MKTPARQRGTTLIEVLIALVVVSVGLLGVAKMQALAISSSRTSAMRSLIAIEAASLASAMHANEAYWQAVTPTFTASVAVNSTGSTATITSSDTAMAGQTASCVSSVCSASQVAASDLGAWAIALWKLVPSTAGSVTCAGSPLTCTVQIQWTENNIAMNGTTQYTNGTQFTNGQDTQTYDLVVQP